MLRALLALSLLLASSTLAEAAPAGEAIDAEVRAAMARTGAKGLALAVIEEGEVVRTSAYGVRNAAGDPLRTDTVMYGASITKVVTAYLALTLVDQGRLELDTPISALLERPLPAYDSEPGFRNRYGPYRDLADDMRWAKITPRMALTHSTGFANFWFLEPDEKLRIHFEPGTRVSYSGEGFALLQFVIENGSPARGLGQDMGTLSDQVFSRLGMTRTSFKWRPDFRPNLADGWNDKGEPQPHDERSRVRAAGSMDTTIDDLAKFAAALVRGDGLSPAARAEMVKPSKPITTAHQFPTLAPELPAAQRRTDLAAGLGVIVFQGPQGPGFFKGGHDEQTANTLVCLERKRRCVVILSNDVRAEAAYARLVRFLLGEAAVPYDWEYGDYAGKS